MFHWCSDETMAVLSTMPFVLPMFLCIASHIHSTRDRILARRRKSFQRFARTR
jgi:hypothetical protein